MHAVELCSNKAVPDSMICSMLSGSDGGAETVGLVRVDIDPLAEHTRTRSLVIFSEGMTIGCHQPVCTRAESGVRACQ